MEYKNMNFIYISEIFYEAVYDILSKVQATPWIVKQRSKM